MTQFTEEQRAEIKAIFQEAMTDWIKTYGLTFKNVVVGVAAVLVGLAVIGKFVAGALALLGFSALK